MCIATEAPQNKDVSTESTYWNAFYTNFQIGVPSQFCVMVSTEADKSRPMIEFGCGNGRDSIYMARQGFSVFAGDLSEEAIKSNQKKDGGIDNANAATFSVCDVANDNHVGALIEQARGGDPDQALSLYNRFFLHSIDDEQERLFLTAMSNATKSGDVLYMEYRCSLDATVDKIYKNHYRRYVNTDRLIQILENDMEFDVTYHITGQGMAKYKTEDPFVSRIVATRR